MKVRYNMVVDFARPSKSNTILIAENDSDSRVAHFTLLFDKAPFDMSDVVSASVQGIIGDKTLLGEATIIENEDGEKINELEYVIPGDMTQIAGTVTMTITLASDSEEVITSFEFYLKVRNALYSEDDYISDEDLAGFRKIFTDTKAALAKLESQLAKTSYPTEEALKITVDGVEYIFEGKAGDDVNIKMGYVAYIDEELGEIEETVDESAAASALESERKAQEHAEYAEEKASEALQYLEDFQKYIPSIDSEREDNKIVITFKDSEKTETREIFDGEKGDQGDQGVSVVDTVDNGDGSFYFNLSDGSRTESVRTIKGDPGEITGSIGADRVTYNDTTVKDTLDNLDQMGSGSVEFTTEAWDNLTDTQKAEYDGIPIDFTDDYDSNVCSSVAECVASQNANDVAGASAISELNNKFIKKKTPLRVKSEYCSVMVDESYTIGNMLYIYVQFTMSATTSPHPIFAIPSGLASITPIILDVIKVDGTSSQAMYLDGENFKTFNNLQNATYLICGMTPI